MLALTRAGSFCAVPISQTIGRDVFLLNLYLYPRVL